MQWNVTIAATFYHTDSTVAGVKYLWKSENFSVTEKKAKNFSETLISIFITDNHELQCS